VGFQKSNCLFSSDGGSDGQIIQLYSLLFKLDQRLVGQVQIFFSCIRILVFLSLVLLEQFKFLFNLFVDVLQVMASCL
jgi:hypothetical protein